MIGNKKEIITYLLNEDDEKKFEIKEYKKKRSRDANAYFHSLVNQLARHFNLSDEETKIKMVLDYGTLARNEDGTVVTVKIPKKTNIRELYDYAEWYGEDGDCNFYMFYKRTHTLNSKEFSQLLNGVVSECKEVGIQTLDEIELQELIKA